MTCPARVNADAARYIYARSTAIIARSCANRGVSRQKLVYWDAGYPGFGVKVTSKGRKVFIVLYRTGGAGSRLRKYTIGPYGRVTLHQARVAAQKVFAAKLEGRDLAAERREARRQLVADRVEDLLETFIAQHVSQIARPVRSQGSFAEKWGDPGPARASTGSPSEMWLR